MNDIFDSVKILSIVSGVVPNLTNLGFKSVYLWSESTAYLGTLDLGPVHIFKSKIKKWVTRHT